MTTALTCVAQAPTPAPGGLSAGGWTIMLLSVGFVTGLLVWCMWRVLATPGEAARLHSQADIEPPDIDT